MKKFAALCLTVLLLLGIGGCSERPPEEQAFRDVGKHMSELDSFACSVSANMNLGGILPVSLGGNGAFHRDPQTCQVMLNLNQTGMSMSMELYTEVLDDKMVAYTAMNSGRGVQWSRTTLPKQKDIMYRLMKYLTIFGQVEVVPDDTLSEDVVRYDCTVGSELLRKLTSLLDIKGIVGKLQGQEPPEPTEPEEPFTIRCYVNSDHTRLLEVRADLSAILDEMVSGELSIRFHSFDSAVDVSIPEAARAAE